MDTYEVKVAQLEYNKRHNKVAGVVDYKLCHAPQNNANQL